MLAPVDAALPGLTTAVAEAKLADAVSWKTTAPSDSFDLCRRLSQEIFDLFLRRRTVLSPLRYPGGKRRLAPYVAAALAENELRPNLFVEPYAGGASVALELLHFDLVDHVVLG